VADYVHLDDVDFGDDDINALFRSWREAIENANRWDVRIGGSSFNGSATDGYSISIPKANKGNLRAAVVTEEISAAPSADVLGSGRAMLRRRNGTALTDDVDVLVLNNFTKSVSVGTRIVVGPEGADWLLIGANCPPVA
jgi:hypothetical protein